MVFSFYARARISYAAWLASSRYGLAACAHCLRLPVCTQWMTGKNFIAGKKKQI